MKKRYYFSHDYNTRSDPKIISILARHGAAGYGVYWCLIEDLYMNANALPTDYESLAFAYHVDVDMVKSIVESRYLFDIDDDIFSSKSVERRLNIVKDKSMKARDSALIRHHGKTNDDAIALRSNQNAMLIKETKVKQSTPKPPTGSSTPSKFKPPELEIVIQHCVSKGVLDPVNAEKIAKKFINFYTSKGWMVGKNKMKSWKSAIAQFIEDKGDTGGAKARIQFSH